MSLKPFLIDGRACPHWAIRLFDNPLRQLVQDPYKILRPYVQPGQRAADLGCGIGYFTIPLARIAGPDGWVIAVDLQEAMLQGVARRAQRHGVAERIRLLRCTPTDLGLSEQVDFILAFWMVHETPDPAAFLRQVGAALAPGGRFLLVEPRLHVGAAEFERSVSLAEEAGMLAVEAPGVFFSRAMVFSSHGNDR